MTIKTHKSTARDRKFERPSSTESRHDEKKRKENINSPAKKNQETRKINRQGKDKKAGDEKMRHKKQRERKNKRYREQSDAKQRKK